MACNHSYGHVTSCLVNHMGNVCYCYDGRQKTCFYCGQPEPIPSQPKEQAGNCDRFQGCVCMKKPMQPDPKLGKSGQKITVCPHCGGKYQYDPENKEGICDVYCNKFVGAGDWFTRTESNKDPWHCSKHNLNHGQKYASCHQGKSDADSLIYIKDPSGKLICNLCGAPTEEEFEEQRKAAQRELLVSIIEKVNNLIPTPELGDLMIILTLLLAKLE